MVMEKHIFRETTAGSSPITLSFHVVQVVSLCKEALDRCFANSIDIKGLIGETGDWKNFPAWMKEYNSTSSTYFQSYCHELKTDSIDVERAMCSDIPWMSAHCMQFASFSGYLFFEPHLRQWLTLYELTFKTDFDANVVGLPRITPSDRRTPRDFYNQLRDFFVISDGVNKKSSVIVELENQARTLIGTAMRQLYGITLNKDTDILIPNSTGNITLFAISSDFANEGSSNLPVLKYFTKAHECAERIGSRAAIKTFPDVPMYIFWGRFHTVAIDSITAVSRIMPIHFQAQLFWAYLSNTDKYIQEVEGSVLAQKLFDDDASVASLNALINSIEYANFMNERFRRSIEGDAELFYRTIEKRWHIDTSLEQNKMFAKFLSNNIDRNLQEQSMKSEKRQNKLLSVIAVLGFLALIDTWSSFLEMANESYDLALENGILAFLFNQSSLTAFNLTFSASVTVLCLIAIVYFVTRK